MVDYYISRFCIDQYVASKMDSTRANVLVEEDRHFEYLSNRSNNYMHQQLLTQLKAAIFLKNNIENIICIRGYRRQKYRVDIDILDTFLLLHTWRQKKLSI